MVYLRCQVIGLHVNPENRLCQWAEFCEFSAYLYACKRAL